jgi:hypothetical protein
LKILRFVARFRIILKVERNCKNVLVPITLRNQWKSKILTQNVAMGRIKVWENKTVQGVAAQKLDVGI